MLSGRLVVRAILLAIAAMMLGVLCTILWVAFYSIVLEPGRSLADYEAYALGSSLTIIVVTGVPILLGAGWLMAHGSGRSDGARVGALAGVAYMVIDLVLLLALAGEADIPWGALALSYATKIAAAAAGGWLATRRALEKGDAGST